MPTILTKPPILIEVLVPGTRNEPGNEPPPADAGCAPASGAPASSATAAVRLPSAVTALILRDFFILPPQVSSTYGKGSPLPMRYIRPDRLAMTSAVGQTGEGLMI